MVKDIFADEMPTYSTWQRWFMDGMGGDRNLLVDLVSLSQDTKEPLSGSDMMKLSISCYNETRKAKNMTTLFSVNRSLRDGGNWSARYDCNGKSLPDSLLLNDRILIVRTEGVVWFEEKDGTHWQRVR